MSTEYSFDSKQRYSDFDRFSSILMNHWVDPLVTNSIEIDLKLKDDIRDLKAYLFSSKDIPEQYPLFCRFYLPYPLQPPHKYSLLMYL